MNQHVSITDKLPVGFVPLQSENGKVVYAACMDANARHYKWLMWKHPDGQWVSQRKLEEWEVMQVEDQAHYGIVLEPAPEPEQQEPVATWTVDVQYPRNTKPAQQEPVAWLIDNDYTTVFRDIAEAHRNKGANVEPLYTRPQAREWVGLTDEEIQLLIPDGDGWIYEVGFEEATEFARAIEAKLKDKNGY